MNRTLPLRGSAAGRRAAWRGRLCGIPLAGVTSLLANLWCLDLALRSGMSTHAAWALAFEVGTLVSFGVHQRFTRRAALPLSAGAVTRRLVRFQLSTLLSLLLNLAVFTVLTHFAIRPGWADLGGIAAGFGLNTTLGLRYAFGS